jgi:hypothetical protein
VAVPPYLWILAAQKRFLDGQKPTKEEAPAAASTARAAARS